MALLQPKNIKLKIAWHSLDNEMMSCLPVVVLEESSDQEGELLASEYCGLNAAKRLDATMIQRKSRPVIDYYQF